MNLQLSDCFLEAQTREDVLIARFTRPVSLCGQLAEDASEALASLLSESDRQRLLVDFTNVQSVTSYMLGQLVTLKRKADAAGKRFALFNLSSYVRQTLEVARLNILLPLYDDESAALRGSP